MAQHINKRKYHYVGSWGTYAAAKQAAELYKKNHKYASYRIEPATKIDNAKYGTTSKIYRIWFYYQD